MQLYFEAKVSVNEKPTKIEPAIAPVIQVKEVFAKKRGWKWPKLIQKFPWIPRILRISETGDPFLSKWEKYHKKHLFYTKLSLPRLQFVRIPHWGGLKSNVLNLNSSKAVTCANFSVEWQPVIKEKLHDAVFLVFWEVGARKRCPRQAYYLIPVPNNLRSSVQHTIGVHKNVSLIPMRGAHIRKVRNCPTSWHRHAL